MGLLTKKPLSGAIFTQDPKFPCCYDLIQRPLSFQSPPGRFVNGEERTSVKGFLRYVGVDQDQTNDWK